MQKVDNHATISFFPFPNPPFERIERKIRGYTKISLHAKRLLHESNIFVQQPHVSFVHCTPSTSSIDAFIFAMAVSRSSRPMFSGGLK